MRKKGQSLTGILLSVIIIGIILAFTVGPAIKYTQNAKTEGEKQVPATEKVKIAKNEAMAAKIFADLTQATMRIKMDNNGTLVDVFRDNEDARNKYRQYMGELGVMNLSFVGFNPDCRDMCGRIVKKGDYTVWILKDGIKSGQNF
ncbi:MAG: hypothetical protein A2Y25_02795 [Candidatus Melainabacteria bacterium GWF2_37_15]|nr:MAG: hypothetical protein A2Y25_02795 [Candidatus Melainabacteria bacterium GWF2_37_15]